jgi:hypothetical protein
MFPASFASMIIKIVLPHVAELLVPIKSDVKKHSQYVNEPNDADIRIDKLEEQMKMMAEDQHPPIFTEEMKKSLEERIAKLEEFEKQVRRKKAFKRKDG